MKYSTHAVTPKVEILHNDHYVAMPYDCSAIEANAEGIIPAGTIVPKNDATAIGVLLSDVVKAENPNGTVVIHGFVRMEKLAAVPAKTAISALSDIKFINYNGVVNPTCTVTYDANGGTGTVTDSDSPYVYGATATIVASTGLTAPTGKAFSKWNTKADGSGTDYEADDKLVVTENVKLYAIWA